MSLLLLGAGVSGPVGFNPNQWDNIVFEYNWDSSGVLTDVDGVNTWGDDSPAGNDATQATGSLKPQLTASSIQGDGSDDRLVSTAILSDLQGTTGGGLHSYTLVIAFNPLTCLTDAANGFDNDGPIGDLGGFFGVYCRSSNLIGVHHAGGGTLEQAVSDVTAKHIAALRWDASGGPTMNLRVDDNAFTAGTISQSSNVGNAVQLFRNFVSTIDGHIYHIVATSDLKPEDEVSGVVEFYNNKIGAF